MRLVLMSYHYNFVESELRVILVAILLFYMLVKDIGDVKFMYVKREANYFVDDLAKMVQSDLTYFMLGFKFSPRVLRKIEKMLYSFCFCLDTGVMLIQTYLSF
ncbi:hypothetical protein V6N13_048684 [Hibiscus sabdariffa]